MDKITDIPDPLVSNLLDHVRSLLMSHCNWVWGGGSKVSVNWLDLISSEQNVTCLQQFLEVVSCNECIDTSLSIIG